MNSKTNVVKINQIPVGGKDFVVIAGPCSIEGQEQFSQTAKAVKEAGACLLRGGIFKLRTNPNSFQGLGSEAFEIVKTVKSEVGLPFVTEISDPRQISDLDSLVDAYQVGSRNMHNYALLKELGSVDKPVLLKRGFCATVEEWKLAAEYIAQGGNENIILCERGIRTFETATRNTLDLGAVAYLKQNTPFPVLVDPSHGTGVRELIEPMSLAAAAAGADGLLIEVHPDPEKALSDGFQALTIEDFDRLMEKLNGLMAPLNRQMLKV